MHMSRAMPPTVLLATVLLPGMLLAACSAPKAPDEERRPTPQAQPKSNVVEAANRYKDTARASVKASEDAAKREQAELDAATH